MLPPWLEPRRDRDSRRAAAAVVTGYRDFTPDELGHPGDLSPAQRGDRAAPNRVDFDRFRRRDVQSRAALLHDRRLTDPPIVSFVSIGRKDSIRNVEATGCFVYNVGNRADGRANQPDCRPTFHPMSASSNGPA